MPSQRKDSSWVSGKEPQPMIVLVTGMPAISVPCGFVGGLPVGLQIVGPHFAEAKILNAAHVYQRETDWHRRVPDAYKA